MLLLTRVLAAGREKIKFLNLETATIHSSVGTSAMNNKQRKYLYFRFGFSFFRGFVDCLQGPPTESILFDTKAKPLWIVWLSQIIYSMPGQKAWTRKMKTLKWFFSPLDSVVACGFAVCVLISQLFRFDLFSKEICGDFHTTWRRKNSVSTGEEVCVCVCVVSINTDSPLYARKFN